MTITKIEIVSIGIVKVWGDFLGEPIRSQPWIHTKLRKARKCACCSTEMARGVTAYRPLTNGKNRADRSCVSCIETGSTNNSTR
jgi:hypothetical protein